MAIPQPAHYAADEETLTHVYTCQSKIVTEIRSTTLEALRSTLSKQTQKMPEDTILNEAIAAQTEIGWEALLPGHISKQWREVYEKIKTKKRATKLILGLCTYSKTIWKERNRVVHGITVAGTNKTET
jgi:hypothetical protein